MKSPRKLYIVISRSMDRDVDPAQDIYTNIKDANYVAAQRNKSVPDWRVETYVKGD